MFAFRNGLLRIRTLTRTLSNETRKDFYDVLGVKPNATQEEIKAAYYVMSKRYHPDKLKGMPDASKRFVAITQAYEVLGNEAMRKKYDSGSLDLSNMPMPRGPITVTEPIFRDRSATIVTTRPTTADFQHWTKVQHQNIRAQEFELKQRLERKKKLKEADSFGLFLEILIIGLLVASVCFAISNPFQDKPDQSKNKPK